MTLDPEVEILLRRAIREHGTSFKETLNSAIRAGLSPGRARASKRVKVPTFDMGQRRGVDLDRVLRLADALEDDAFVRKLEIGK